jgi:hypothetical protein
MAFGRKDDNDLTTLAETWRKEGHTVYVHRAMVGRDVSDIAIDIESIEAAGWHLDNVSANAPTAMLMVFRYSIQKG